METAAVGVTVAFDNDGSVYDNLNRTVDYFLCLNFHGNNTDKITHPVEKVGLLKLVKLWKLLPLVSL